MYVHVVLCLVTQSCPTLCNPIDCSLPGSSVRGDSPGKNTGVGCYSFLQGIFPTQGWNLGLPALQANSLPSQPSGKLLFVGEASSIKPTWPFSEACVALRTLLPFSIHHEGFREEDSRHVNPQTLRRGSWFSPVLSSDSLRAKVKMS